MLRVVSKMLTKPYKKYTFYAHKVYTTSIVLQYNFVLHSRRKDKFALEKVWEKFCLLWKIFR
jgi:hypothetical protein